MNGRRSRRWRMLPRVGVALPICALLLWVSVGVTLNMQFADQAPAVALRWWPWGAEAKAGLAKEELAGQITPAKARSANRLSRQSLAREPVLAPAASLTGLAQSSLEGDRRAEPAFVYAQSVSRRDLPTQLWFIQRQVEAGNVIGALTHYDIAMRTDTSSEDLLLPVLATASEGNTIAHALMPYLARRSSWTSAYLGRLATVASNPDTLFLQARAARLRPASDAGVLYPLVNRLVALDRPDLGRALLGPTYQGLLQDGSFESGEGSTPFDWWLRNEPDLSAFRDTMAGGDGPHVLHIVAKAGNGGEVARQLLLLPAGRYVFGGNTAAIGDGMTLTMVLTCGHSGIAVVSASAPASAVPGRFVIPFTVPARCPSQWLQVITPPAQSVDGWIDALSIAPEHATLH